MGRRKKNILNTKELDEINILHNMNNIDDINKNIIQPVQNIINIEQVDNVIVEKKKRGRKKKIQTEEIKEEKIIISEEKIIISEEKIINSEEKIIISEEKIINSEENKNLEEKIINSEENKNYFFKELLTKQLKNICQSKKLLFSDIKRISKFLSDTIFDENKCSLWNGYITNEKNQSKGTYINFYFNKKKIALHRLLYINYIGDISVDEYIKFSCDNKGKCCCIHHMKKYSYNKQLDDTDSESININNNEHNNIHINTNKDKLVVEF
jgi:hypothetical protein